MFEIKVAFMYLSILVGNLTILEGNFRTLLALKQTLD